MTYDEIDAVQRRFDHEMQSVGWCRGFPAPDAIRKLAAKGIDLKPIDALIDCLRNVDGSPDFQFSKEAMEREQKIEGLARDLANALSETSGDGGWRVLHDPDEPATVPDAIDVMEFIENLMTLQTTARQRVQQFRYAEAIGVRPGSGRAPTSRYFYWLALLAFWRHSMGRKIATSTDAMSGKATGPLVTFMEIMSEGMEDRATTTAMQKFVRRHKGDADRFAREFMPAGVMRLRTFADVLRHGR